jgi:pentatricopeptide repeat protein
MFSAAAKRAFVPMRLALPPKSSRTLSQLSFHHHSSSRPAFEAVWQHRAAPAQPGQCTQAAHKWQLAAIPLAAAMFLATQQQVPDAQSAELQDALTCEAKLLAYYENGNMAEVVRVYEALVQQGHGLSAEAATNAAHAYVEIGQAEVAATVVDTLLKQGHQAQGMQQMAWADAYYMAGRLEAARDLLQQAVLTSPQDDAMRVSWLCDVHMRLDEWTSIPAAIAQRPTLSTSDVEWLQTLDWCNDSGADATDFELKAVTQAVNGQHRQALITIEDACSKGLILDEKIYILLMIACCASAKLDSLHEVLSTMAALGVNLDVHNARRVTQACATHDSASVNELPIALQGVAPLNAQCCAVAIAAALELRDVDTALEWFDMMQQQGIERDENMYAAMASACCRNHGYHDCMHVIEQAKAVGLMSEPAESDSSALKLLRASEAVAESSFELVQTIVGWWVREGSSTLDLTRQGCVPQRLATCYDNVELTVLAVRALLSNTAQHRAAETWLVTQTALLAANYLIFEGPFSDTLKIKFRTGSTCGDQLARELRAELESDAISVSSNSDDGTTTYSMHVPGLRVYCADRRRKMLLEVIPEISAAVTGQQHGEQ